MKEMLFNIGDIPAVLYGDDSDKLYLFVHGKHGCKEEARPFAEIVCPKGWQVLAVDLPRHGVRQNGVPFDPWHAVPELRAVMEFSRARWTDFSLRATSIGAWFSMLAFGDEILEKALFDAYRCGHRWRRLRLALRFSDASRRPRAGNRRGWRLFL